MRLPTVRLRHKKKGVVITVNEWEWARDLGKYKWSAFERVGERHNDAAAPLNVTAPEPSSTPAPTPRGRGRPRKYSV